MPLDRAPDDRLHNSGWGRPAEQYRTPAIGAGFVLDLPGMLRAWRGADAEDAAAMAEVAPSAKRYPSPLVARYARALTRDIGGEPGKGDAVRALAALRNAVAARGLIEGVILTWHTTERATWLGDGRPPFAPTTEQMAVALAAGACAQRPLVLWSGEPSLGSLTPNHVLVMRWLRSGAVGPAAESCWKTLAYAHRC